MKVLAEHCLHIVCIHSHNLWFVFVLMLHGSHLVSNFKWHFTCYPKQCCYPKQRCKVESNAIIDAKVILEGLSGPELLKIAIFF